ncbi:hypothetical protein [Streptomyces sp. NPDC003023]|uniref:hypothetical protein n=1 Tax=Streptomyces sp. NPDC003023 TaxID=3364675 RepID=UPI0036B07E29
MIPAVENTKARTLADPKLAEALRNGPFSEALRLAIRCRGLTLDRIQHRLRQRGLIISTTTLSYWQRGHNQPERPESLRAVAELEDVLGLPGGSLRALIGPPRPRGRWLQNTPGMLATHQLWDAWTELIDTLSGIGASPQDFSTFTSVATHKRTVVDANRHTASTRRNVTVRAERDGLRRIVLISRQRDLLRAPEVTSTVYCRLGRARCDINSGFQAIELLLEHELGLGEHATIQFEIVYPPGNASTLSRLFVRNPRRQLTHEIIFSAEALPISCVHSYRPQPTAPLTDERELQLGSSHLAQHVAIDPLPGIYGIRWSWD